MAQPFKIYVLGGPRDLPSIAIDKSNSNTILGITEFLSIGTTGFTDISILFKIDLSGIPYGVDIVSAILNLKVTTAAAAGTDDELRYEVMPICAGLDIDFKSCTWDSYDGINPWPLERYDSSVRLTGIMPTSTGSWDITDLKPIINRALAHGENELVIVIQRVFSGSPHKLITITSNFEPVNIDKPILTITHNNPIVPATVIKNGRLSLVKPNNHRTRSRIPYGHYDLDGQDLIVSEDGQQRIKAVGSNMHLWAAGAAQMIIKNGGIDGGGVKRLTNWRGMKDSFVLGWNGATATTTLILNGPVFAFSGSDGALFIPYKNGSIVGLACWLDVNIIGTGGDVKFESKIKGVVALTATIASVIVGNRQIVVATAAVGTHTFLAGDWLHGTRLLTNGAPGQVTTDDLAMMVTIEYD